MESNDNEAGPEEMPEEMKEKIRIAAKAGEIVCASDALLRQHQTITYSVMNSVFGYNRSYMITDESSFSDFIGVNGLETIKAIHAKIKKLYDIDLNGMTNVKIVDVVVMVAGEDTKQ